MNKFFSLQKHIVHNDGFPPNYVVYLYYTDLANYLCMWASVLGDICGDRVARGGRKCDEGARRKLEEQRVEGVK